MTIETAGVYGVKYRQKPDQPNVVQMQERKGARWKDTMTFADPRGAQMWIMQAQQANSIAKQQHEGDGDADKSI